MHLSGKTPFSLISHVTVMRFIVAVCACVEKLPEPPLRSKSNTESRQKDEGCNATKKGQQNMF